MGILSTTALSGHRQHDRGPWVVPALRRPGETRVMGIGLWPEQGGHHGLTVMEGSVPQR